MPSSSRRPSSLARQRPPSPAVIRRHQLQRTRLADRRRPPLPLPSCRRTSNCCPAALTVPPPRELLLSRRPPFGIAVVDAAADDAPHANMVTMAPSPLVRNHVKK